MQIIDTFAFCRNGEQRSGKLMLSELSRLRSECISDEGEVNWVLAGVAESVKIGSYPEMHLTVNGVIQLLCQRCLTPYVFKFNSETKLCLAKDEESADQIESVLDDEEIEVIAGSKEFDVLALIEDEVLLAIPLSPKHEVCPDKAKLDAFAIAKKESPFAALKGQFEKEKFKN